MPNDKKMKRLEALLDTFDSGAVQPEELIQAVEAIVSIINNEKDRLDKVIADNKDLDKQEKSDLLSSVSEKLDSKVTELKNLISNLSTNVDGAISRTSSSLSKEIKRVQAKIPTKTDLSVLETDIQALREGLNSLPTEFTLNNEAVRDGLELLQGDERLDVSAIKGLDERDGKMSDSLIERAISIVDNRTSFLINKVSKLQAQVDAGGTGGGHTIEDEGTPLTQRDTLNFVGAGVTVTDDAGNDATVVTIPGGGGMNVETPIGSVNSSNVTFTVTVAPKFIVTDTGFYIEGFGYSRATLTITMDLSPNLFIRAYS